ncbi:MAG: type II toxin-antitoxin system Phd/YefM family antitoxin [Actinomycetota bacterium]
MNIHDAKTNFSKLIRRVMAGEEITIARAGKPVARLVPIDDRRKRAPGALEGKIWMAPDFDELPAELKHHFE